VSAAWTVAVVGGSLAGLAAAAELSRATDAEITVFEHTAGPLEGRGAGIVMQPEIEFLLSVSGIAPDAVSVGLRERQLLHRFSPPRTFPMPQTMTAWDTLYRTFRAAIPGVDYRQGTTVTGVTPGEQGVDLTFADGTTSTWMMVIGADGIGSTVRQSISAAHPQYTGYVAWRGLENESDLPEEITRELTDRFTLYSANGIQFLCYLVPGPAGETAPGHRRVNWVWYVNASEEAFGAIMTGQSGRGYEYFLPATDVSEASMATLLMLADTHLPPLMSRLVRLSKPFLQPVMDLASARMRRGPVFVIGDAAGTVRPHTASGTSKSIADAALLAQALRGWTVGEPLPEDDLHRWEQHRLRSLEDLAAIGITRAVASRLGTRDSSLVWDHGIQR
jgi:2-polyprenyl-6-methoxyphenol hydroxylase-like FAD-dependent oxidoreductase